MTLLEFLYLFQNLLVLRHGLVYHLDLALRNVQMRVWSVNVADVVSLIIDSEQVTHEGVVVFLHAHLKEAADDLTFLFRELATVQLVL